MSNKIVCKNCKGKGVIWVWDGVSKARIKVPETCGVCKGSGKK